LAKRGKESAYEKIYLVADNTDNFSNYFVDFNNYWNIYARIKFVGTQGVVALIFSSVSL